LRGLRHALTDHGGVARDDLAGLPTSDDDNVELQGFGRWVEVMWLRTSDMLGG
jgi:hypothetical protein